MTGLRNSIRNNLLIAFSGGETSAYMTKYILENKLKEFDDVVVLFANTGQENEKTLDFVNKCDVEFGFNVVWLECLVHEKKGVGTTYKVVDYVKANRDGKPFEEVIRKYGIPNQTHPICTRELKLRPIQAYVKDLGWRKRDYKTALGIRYDEVERVSSNMERDRIVYPLIDWSPTTKSDIKAWWKNQAFTLGLAEHQGNCTWCWKKSKRKLLTLLQESPEIFDFPSRMEEQYSNVELGKAERRVFFRGDMSVKDLIEEAKRPFKLYHDPYYTYDEDLDSSNGCSESCEVFPTK